MKTRNGFVSNSSSSSFCIYGTALETDCCEIFKTIKNKSPEAFKKLKDWVKTWEHPEEMLAWLDNMSDDYPEAIDDIDIVEVLEDVFDKDISIHAPGDYDTIYVGREWKDIGGDETGNEFKKDVEKKLSKILGNVKCDTYEEAWRDG